MTKKICIVEIRKYYQEIIIEIRKKDQVIL